MTASEARVTPRLQGRLDEAEDSPGPSIRIPAAPKSCAATVSFATAAGTGRPRCLCHRGQTQRSDGHPCRARGRSRQQLGHSTALAKAAGNGLVGAVELLLPHEEQSRMRLLDGPCCCLYGHPKTGRLLCPHTRDASQWAAPMYAARRGHREYTGSQRLTKGEGESGWAGCVARCSRRQPVAGILSACPERGMAPLPCSCKHVCCQSAPGCIQAPAERRAGHGSAATGSRGAATAWCSRRCWQRWPGGRCRAGLAQ